MSMVGMNCDVFVKADAGYVPFKTWYVRSTVIISGVADMAALEFRKDTSAVLLGVRMVILLAIPRVDRTSGCVARSDGRY